MKMTKRFVSFVLALVMLFASSSVAFAADAGVPAATAISSAGIQPHLNVFNSYELDTRTWQTVVTDNNIINADVTITADINNPGSAFFRVLDGNGKLIIPLVGPLNPGEEIQTGTISAFAGTYKIEAQATAYSGIYYFHFQE